MMRGFKPYGIHSCRFEKISMTFEEYESLRLVAYQMLSQDEAAGLMNVSRPTLTRIYNKSLKKIAQALIEGRPIEFEGGNYELDEEWYRCWKCHRVINGIANHTRCSGCNEFGENELIKLNQNHHATSKP
jgi:predicted DNA-binding protein (UPF0251 family)